MDVVKTMRYKFVRYCVNKAYAEVDLKDLPAEVLNAFDDVVNQIRDLEKYFTSIEAIAKVLRGEVLEKLNVLRERSPALAEEFLKRVVEHCMELEEVADSPLRDVFQELLRRFNEAKK